MLKTFLRSAAALVILVAMNMLLDLTVIPPLWGAGDEWLKLEELRRHPERFNALVIGNSRAAREIMPAQLDGISDQGVPLQFMNVGIPAMTGPEELYVLQTVLRSGIRPRLVLLQIIPVRGPGPSTRGSARSRYYLTLQTMMHTLRGIRTAPIENRYDVMRVFLLEYTKKVLHFNVLNEVLLSLNQMVDNPTALGPKGDGFFALDWYQEGTKIFNDHREYLAAHPTGLQSIRSTVKASESPDCRKFATKATIALLNSMRRTAEQAGATAIFFQEVPNASPQIECIRRALNEESALAPLSTGDFPKLYDPEMYFDDRHLNAKGAALYSGILRKQLTDLLGDQH